MEYNIQDIIHLYHMLFAVFALTSTRYNVGLQHDFETYSLPQNISYVPTLQTSKQFIDTC